MKAILNFAFVLPDVSIIEVVGNSIKLITLLSTMSALHSGELKKDGNKSVTSKRI